MNEKLSVLEKSMAKPVAEVSEDEDDDMSFLPVKSIADFEKFEIHLKQNKDVSMITQLGKRITKISQGDYVKRAWGCVIATLVAKELKWLDRPDKRRLGGRVLPKFITSKFNSYICTRGGRDDVHINRVTRGNIGLTDGNFGIDSHRLQVLAKIRPASPLALPASAEPHVVVRPPEMAKKTFRDIPPFIGADSKVESRRGVASQKRNKPSLLLSPPSRSRICWCGRPRRRETAPQDITPFIDVELRVERRRD
ncbi:hypothetical protein DAPPUDRAFT_107513 [Daphnia pulex]|uniref:DUF4806 domain-containing protein n=1 Tax=Daphnia pulex TaxID=6669 RepID=E9GXC3_DAPPU|nr:hypothetical protein DAPPUDRAFT_107513 [Daphnia pulex]|eukprot:EFX75884.1 hypothetical protein DAPPUDRAFT_107513 [Daphnia pulex]